MDFAVRCEDLRKITAYEQQLFLPRVSGGFDLETVLNYVSNNHGYAGRPVPKVHQFPERQASTTASDFEWLPLSK